MVVGTADICILMLAKRNKNPEDLEESPVKGLQRHSIEAFEMRRAAQPQRVIAVASGRASAEGTPPGWWAPSFPHRVPRVPLLDDQSFGVEVQH